MSNLESDDDISDNSDGGSSCYDGYDSGETIEGHSDDVDEAEVEGLERVNLIEELKTSKSWKKESEEIIRFGSSLLGVLKEVVKVKGEFALSGQLIAPPILPIYIKGYGKISLPLYEEKVVEPLLEFFKKSPHGLKEKTILDESVRKSWELKDNEFSIVNPAWDKYLVEKIIPEIAEGMKLEYSSIEAQLYKLLLYESGSFFKPHRDSEKEDGMFGSLIIQLPSKFTGGELIVRHEGKEKIFDFGNNKENEVEESKEFSMFFAAFYCDLEHEVKPLVEGYRVSLVYNLISKVGGEQEEPIKAPLTLDMDAQVEKFTQLLNEWKYLSPKKFIYVLSHKYTICGLSLEGLKNGDRSLGQFMKLISEKTGLCVALGILVTQEHGTPEFNKGKEKSYICHYTGSNVKMMKKLGGSLEKEGWYEIEVFVKYLLTLEDQVRICPKFEKRPAKKDERGNDEHSFLTIFDDSMMVDFNNEILGKESFKGILADYMEYEGYTGNEGMQLSRWYNKSVLVFWPKNHPLEEIWTATGDPPREIASSSSASDARGVMLTIKENLLINPLQLKSNH